MEKINNLLNNKFPSCKFNVEDIIEDVNQVVYTYVGKINHDDLMVSFSEKSTKPACILIALKNDNCNISMQISEFIEYLKAQIIQLNIEDFGIEVQDALKEDGIEISKNFSMDIVVGRGTNIKHAFP